MTEWDQAAADEWALSPAGALRAAVGQPEVPAMVAEFQAELPDRELAKRDFELAWGFSDERGMATERGRQRIELRAVHQANATGASWLAVTETEEREIVRRMKASGEAVRIAASAMVTRGPMSPAEVQAWQQQATGPVAGVAKADDGW